MATFLSSEQIRQRVGTRGVTLRNIDSAVGRPTILIVGDVGANPQCAVRRVVDAALNDVSPER